GCNGGSFTIDRGAQLFFSQQDFTSNDTYRVEPSGSMSGDGDVAVGTVYPGGLDVLGSFNLGGRTTVANGTAEFASPATTATATLAEGGTLTGVGDFTVTGLLTWTGGKMLGTGSTFANGGMEITKGQLYGRTLHSAGNTNVSGSGQLALTNGAVLHNLAGATFDVGNTTWIYMSGSTSSTFL